MSFQTWPEEIPFGNVKISSIQPNYQSITHSRKALTRTQNIQQYEISFDVTVNEQNSRLLDAFLAELGGRLNPFYFQIPRRSSSQNRIYGTVQVSEDLPHGKSEIPVHGFSGTIKAGDYIQFQNDPKMYLATKDCTSGGYLKIVPSLRKPVLVGDELITDGTKFLVRLSSDTVETTSAFYGVTTLKLKVIEHL